MIKLIQQSLNKTGGKPTARVVEFSIKDNQGSEKNISSLKGHKR